MGDKEKDPDLQVAWLASRQFGAFSKAQALEAGLSLEQIHRRQASGQWQKAAPTVYRLTAARADWHQETMIACLAGPAGTRASHLSAAALFNLTKAPEIPHVTVPSSSNGRSKQANVHRSTLQAIDTCKIGVFPATTPARTIIDCAELLAFEAFCNLLDSALCRKLANPTAIRQALERAGRKRKATALLEQALEVWTPGPLYGSQAEARLMRQLARWGLPLPERQYKIFDGDGSFIARIDLVWVPLRFGLEYDGQDTHGPRRWEADNQREANIEVVGWRIERVNRFDLRLASSWLPDLLTSLLKRVA